MDLLWVLIVGGLIGWLSGNLIGRDVPGGVLGNIIAGFIGSWLGTELLGPRGPVIDGFHIIPAIFRKQMGVVPQHYRKQVTNIDSV